MAGPAAGDGRLIVRQPNEKQVRIKPIPERIVLGQSPCGIDVAPREANCLSLAALVGGIARILLDASETQHQPPRAIVVLSYDPNSPRICGVKDAAIEFELVVARVPQLLTYFEV